MFHLLFLVYVMLFLIKNIWYISSEDVLEKTNFGLGGSAGRLGRGFQTRPKADALPAIEALTRFLELPHKTGT